MQWWQLRWSMNFGGILKLRRQDFANFWPPLPLCRQVYYISLCSSIGIWLTPLACLRSLWMPPLHSSKGAAPRFSIWEYETTQFSKLNQIYTKILGGFCPRPPYPPVDLSDPLRVLGVTQHQNISYTNFSLKIIQTWFSVRKGCNWLIV